MSAPTIQEVLFPSDISEGAEGGPEWSTLVIAGSTGAEQRIQMWDVARHSWDVSHALVDPIKAATLAAFFYARRGKRHGFRFYDWHDHTATNEVFVVTGTPTAQLTKTYTDAIAITYVRNIYKVASSPTATFRKNAGTITPSLAVNTGIVTLTALNTKSITAITQASSAVVTVGASHGFVSGDLVYFSGVVGMTQINGLVGQVTTTGASTITVNINSTAFTAYSSGGTAVSYAKVTDVFDWTGEFHVPVRFDIDKMRLVQESVEIRNWSAIPIIEIIG